MILLSLKIILQILAVLIAIIVSGLDYVIPDKRTTKFKSWRKWLFILSGVFLMGSIILTILDGIDNSQKEQQSKSQIEKLQNQNDILQNDIHRAANPISDVTISYELSISLDTPSGIEYRNRIKQAISELSQQSNGLQKMGTIMGNGEVVQRIDITKRAYMPEENREFSAYIAVNFAVLSVDFYKSSIPIEILTANEPSSDLQIRVIGAVDNRISTRNDSQGSGVQLIYELNEQYFTINAHYLPSVSYYQLKSGKITAIPDLSETQMVIWLFPVNTSEPNANAEIKKIYESIKLKSFTIRMSGGREFSFKQNDLQKYSHKDGGLIYVCQFPKTL